MSLRFIAAISLFIISACGGSDPSAPISSVGNADSDIQAEIPQVPHGATAADVECRNQREFLDPSGVSHSGVGISRDVEHYWQDGDVEVTYSQSVEGDYHVLVRVKIVKLDGGRTRYYGTGKSWFRGNDGKWERDSWTYEKEVAKVGDGSMVVSYKWNGVDTPYYWQTRSYSQADGATVVVQLHTNPSVRNTADRRYTKIEVSCTYRDRR